ncbi:MAG TPA: type II toxin-antitoxin system RelE/ParE family toxin [Rhodoferax sp.]|nr:type II toxin-antitoxin system RelE/ParE family toxin [Rhodoferax sp.]
MAFYATRWHRMSRRSKTRYLSRWMRKNELNYNTRCAAVSDMAQGLIDADLVGGARAPVATNKAGNIP